MKQSDLFLESEGDAFYARNKDKPRLPDPVIDAIETCNLHKTAPVILELGCGNGWRLAEMKRRFPCTVRGYDASKQAVEERVEINVFQSDILEALKNIRTAYYNIIIFGFCLYLVDREELMLIAAHADRVLRDLGHIVIHDFWDGPYRIPYKHKDGMWSYHADYSLLWRGNPAYKIVETKDAGEWVAVQVLRKDLTAAWPERAI